MSKYIEVECRQHTALSGRVTITRRKAETGLIVEERTFDNMIVDAGLNEIAASRSIVWIFVGQGTAPESSTDTQLVSYLTGKPHAGPPIQSVGPAPDYIGSTQYKVQFTPGEATGTITECGFGWMNASPPSGLEHRCFARTLIKDGGGSPVAITVLSDEYLDVTWVFNTHMEVGDATYTFNIGSATHTVEAQRPMLITTASVVCLTPSISAEAYGPDMMRAGDSTQSLQSITADVSYPAANTTSVAHSYIANTFYREHEVTFSPSVANFVGGIHYLTLRSANVRKLMSPFQLKLSPLTPILKDDTKALVFLTRRSWGRYTP